MSSTRTSAVARLTAEHDNGTTAPKVSRKAIPLGELTTEEAVFQMRVEGLEERWVVSLINKINEGDGKLDPLLVWWSGERWVVMDGHHRLAAYRNHAGGRQLTQKFPWLSPKQRA